MRSDQALMESQVQVRRSSRGGLMRGARALVCAVALLGCAPPSDAVAPAAVGAIGASEAATPAADLLEQLRAVAGVTNVEESPSPLPGSRFFVITFEQEVNHLKQGGPRFPQTLTLLYRSADAPTVMVTTGYSIPRTPFLTEPSYALQANQLAVEHRFFPPSSPQPPDWPQLNIYQAATDQHRIYEAFRGLMPKRWAATGGSKGGMTAVYYRFFYPHDMAATIPYVAPSSHSPADPRYIRFLNRVGSRECRDKLKAAQRTLLLHHDDMTQRMTAEAQTLGDGFTTFGVDRTFEFAVLELPFTFWQYTGSSGCATVPSADATADALYTWLGAVYFGVTSAWGDQAVQYFSPYYYQAATELGGPLVADYYLRDLLHVSAFDDIATNYPPFGVTKPFNFFAMPVIENWVRERGQQLLFVYGQNDPWSTSMFQVSARNDSLRYIVAEGTHGAGIRYLPADQQAEALAALSRWMDAPTIPLPQPVAPVVAEDQQNGAALLETMMPPVRRAIP